MTVTNVKLIYCFFSFFVFFQTYIFAQKSIAKGKIYALVIGISEYKDEDFTDLKFAHRDAELFADFLYSPAGGSVPKSQVKLLVNKQATVSNIYLAKRWLETEAKKNDLVYFYFAGHGDVEGSIYKLGYLLAYDTPFGNYLNNAVRIEDFNIMANTLSVEKNANVILITDACRSGKLAGSDNRGKALIGEQLNKVEKNEIRMASCEADQDSEENEVWGNGRGAFSYFLLNGLKGLADDGEKDGVITLQELSAYLAKKVPDEVSKITQKDQNPVSLGKPNKLMAIVNDSILKSLATQSVISTTSGDLSISRSISSEGAIERTSMQKFLGLMKNRDLETAIDFSQLLTMSADEASDFIFNHFRGGMDSLEAEELYLQRSLNPKVNQQFKQHLAATIHDRIQLLINLYLKGDEEELERRQYYNSGSDVYDKYPIMIETALKFLNKDQPLYHILEVKKYYFAGIALKLKIPLSTNPDSLVDLALGQQLKAYQLEANAAYIHNELGNLYRNKKEYDVSLEHYQKATEIAPSWSIPWSNMSSLYAFQKKINLGIEAGKRAVLLQDRMQGAHTNLGRNYEVSENLLFAEEQYRKAIQLDTNHFLPIERLGCIKLKAMNYEYAEECLKKADEKKEGFFPDVNGIEMNTEAGIMVDTRGMALEDSYSPTRHIEWPEPKDPLVFFYMGMQNLDQSNFQVAERYFNKLVQACPKDPLVFKYLTKLMYAQNRYLEAELMIKKARENYLMQGTFNKYSDSLVNAHIATATDRALFKPKVDMVVFYKNQQFDQLDLDYYAGKLYEKWGYYDDAQNYYRRIIQADKSQMKGYYHLWNMLESQGRYDASEQVIQEFKYENKIQGEKELYAFYVRMLASHPKEEYYYNAGLLMYNYAESHPDLHQRIAYSVYPWNEPVAEDLPFGIIGQPVDLMALQTEINGAIEYDLMINPAKSIKSPIQDGIHHLEQFSTLSKDSSLLSEVHSKTGDLYYWSGSENEALKSYQTSLSYSDKQAKVRMKLADGLERQYQYENSLSNLILLQKYDQINYESSLKLANFQILSGQFESARNLLLKCDTIIGVKDHRIEELMAKLNFISGNYQLALPYYLEEWKYNSKDLRTNYTLCRLYAKMNDRQEAFKFLKLAFDNGFNLNFVLNNDEMISDLRNDQRWDEFKNRLN
ncbi:MAG: caspase family protein [Saprospiraceae bacterium]|nr:caspase family protein [Candidatus Vicinibacter affinis]